MDGRVGRGEAAAIIQFAPDKPGAARGTVLGTAANETSEGWRRWGELAAPGSGRSDPGGRTPRTGIGGVGAAPGWSGVGVVWEPLMERGPQVGWKSGPGDPAPAPAGQRSQEPPQTRPGSEGARQPAGVEGAGWGGVGKGASVAPALSAVIGRPPGRGPRHLLPGAPARPLRFLRGWSGPGR